MLPAGFNLNDEVHFLTNIKYEEQKEKKTNVKQQWGLYTP